MPTICIPLLGKGATNHLHRAAIVEEFRRRGYDVMFLVRNDYVDLLKRLDGCSYVPYTIPSFRGWVARCFDICLQLRYQYPSIDPWRRWRYKTLRDLTPRWISRQYQYVIFLLAGSRRVMQWVVALEGWLYRRFDDTRDLDALPIDRLLVLGIGTWADNVASRITWWALRRKKPIVHFIGNYDGLSSKGFRGHPVQKVLVWGPRMQEDAIQLQAISPDRVEAIGSLRYNLIPRESRDSRETILRRMGLDPSGRILVFAGSSYEFQYFEMIKILDLLKRRDPEKKWQLIIRVYPDKNLLDSPHMDVLVDYVRTRPDIHLSVADPSYTKRTSRAEVLQIDEDELWPILRSADVVINIFSTLTLEACLFDKPVINMWYFYEVARAFRQPVYYPYPLTLHIQRVTASQATVLAEDRAGLVAAIDHAILNPAERAAARRRLVECECGVLDGHAVQRLVDAAI